MATLKLFPYFEIIDVAGVTHSGGSRSNAAELAVTGEVFDVSAVMAIDVQETLWSAGDGGIGSFDFLWIETDLDGVNVAFESDTVTTSVVYKLSSKQPLIIMNDDILIDSTADVQDPILALTAVIDKIVVENVGLASVANVRLVLVD